MGSDCIDMNGVRLVIFCFVFIVANSLSCFVWGQFNLYEPFVGVDVGDFVERAVVRGGGIVDGRSVGKLIGGAVTAVDDDGDAWGWCLFAVKDGMKKSEKGVDGDDDAYHHNEKDLRIMFYFEANDGGRVRFDDIPEVVKGVNTHHEIVGNDGNGIFYSLLATNGTAGPNKVVELSGLVMFPRANRSTAQAWSAAAINDKGWIAGSYSPDGAGGTTRPMLFIPQDVNNNQVPDIREILQARIDGSGELDVNGNWLLDWAENDPSNSLIDNMRVGLHAPGCDGSKTKANMITNNQIVRLTGLNLERIDQGTNGPNYTGGDNEISVIDLSYDVQDCNSKRASCLAFLGDVEAWNNDGTKQREVIFTIRNPLAAPPDLVSNFDDFEPVGTPKRQSQVDAIRVFGYRWARCADYIQFGNEMFSGAAEIQFNSGDLPGGYTGKFSNITQKNDLIEATAAVLDWVEEQSEAARIGSALAGRPWRFIGPAHPLGNVNLGAKGDPDNVTNPNVPWPSAADGTAYVIREENIMLNENRMYFDMHVHYKKVTDAEDGLNNLTDTTLGWGVNVPQAVMVLEFGPKGDTQTQWWGLNGGEFDKYFSLQPPLPKRPWENFIIDITSQFGPGWEFGQFNAAGFDMINLMDKIQAKPYAAVCYGPTIQGPNLGDVFAPAALRATSIPENAGTDYILDPLRFTPLRGDYETMAGLHQIPLILFTPHDVACDQNVVCPPCGN